MSQMAKRLISKPRIGEKKMNVTAQELFAKIGEQHLAIEDKDKFIGGLLGVFAGVLKGEIEPSRVMLNLTSRSWIVAPEHLSPGMPATVNGLPECVVGKPWEAIPETTESTK